MEKIKDIYYWFYRIWKYKIKIFPREVKWFIQRGRRGYADCDVWDFHSHLTRVIEGGLKQMAKEAHGCPNQFYDENNEDNSFQSWKDELNAIAKGFRDYQDIVIDNSKLTEMVYDGHELKHENHTITCTPEVPKEKYDIYYKMIKDEEKKFKEGIAPRFIKIYVNLWD